ncbi:MAG: S-methyl-5-thioribose-1-phosphate isomerase [Acidimicrobiia bacterium]
MESRDDPIPPTVAWVRGSVRLIDQRRLPGTLEHVDCRTVDALVDAIRDLAVRGAPALGVTGAYGVALAARDDAEPGAVEAAAARLRSARPTAVNLARGVDDALAAFRAGGAAASLERAHALAREDVVANRALGRVGATLLPEGARVLTHCNAGALACVGYGSAIGVIRAGFAAGRVTSVWVDETRPVLQGARLTAWELDRLGIPFRIVVDAAAGSLFAAGLVDAVVVGADRIAANGDVANKIGTYPLAVLADAHAVPFYVAAPTSTIDPATASGADIPIEHRDGDEVLTSAAARWPDAVHNPAFDVTPVRLVTAIVTEHGVLAPPFST